MAVVDMAAVELPTSRRRWRFEDLLELPESDWRFEIVDGGLHMTPPPSLYHDGIWLRLRDLIRDAVPAAYVVHGPTAIDLDPSYLIPDVAVLRRDAVQRGRNLILPSEALLVVEVVSPGSLSADRILKPATYAAAGIPHFWRVEFRPELSLTAYALPAADAADQQVEPGREGGPTASAVGGGHGPRTYAEVGTWTTGQTAAIEAPFQVEIDVAELAPDR